MKYQLSYINFSDGSTQHFDKLFSGYEAIEEFIKVYTNITSYQIIVIVG